MEPVNGSPEWWLERLGRALDARQKDVETARNWYTGAHPLPSLGNALAVREAEVAYRALLTSSTTNWLALVADAPAERLQPIGVRTGDDQADLDQALWAKWQENQLDSDAPLAIGTALQQGESFALVWPDDTLDGGVSITVEDACCMIVAYQPGSRRKRAAALKRWVDDDGLVYATLYLPDWLYKWRSTAKRTQYGQLVYEPLAVPGETWPLINPTGLVPVVEIRANPDLEVRPYGGGTPEFAKVIPIQERINRTMFGRMVTQEFSSFRQRWATGIEVDYDAQGKAVNPYRPGVDRLWIDPNTDTQFGEFSESDLTGFLSSATADVTAMAAITKTPPYYLLGNMVNLAASAIKASEAGLIAKCQQHAVHFGEAFEEILRLASLTTGGDGFPGMQLLWRDVEARTMGETVDAVLKMQALNVPQEALWAMLPGVTPQDIERWKVLKAAEPPPPVMQVAPPPPVPFPAPGAPPAPVAPQ